MSKRVRTSSLDAGAQCTHWESDFVGADNVATRRGTRLDEAFRACLQLDWVTIGNLDLTTEERESIDWAVKTVMSYCTHGEDEIGSTKEECKVFIPMDDGHEYEGEVDALLLSRNIHFDLKSGQMRSYYHQQLGYACGYMAEMFQTEWTAVVLFLDQREVHTYHYTIADMNTLHDVARNMRHRAGEPTPCDYCGWCAKQLTCPAVGKEIEPAIDSMEALVDAVTAELIIERVCESPEKMGQFLIAVDQLNSLVYDEIKKRVKDMLMNEEEVPGWKLITRKGSEKVKPEDLAPHIDKRKIQNLLSICGDLSANKVREIWDETSNEEFPEGIVRTSGPITFVQKSRAKKQTKKLPIRKRK